MNAYKAHEHYLLSLTAPEIVAQLDQYIIGQDDAKKSVAIALRNRYRRSKLPEALQEEISPRNMIMIGPTGVGKTEIVRRLSKLLKAPYVKVEATKFTEVGYVGRDVESIIRDLLETAIRMVKEEKQQQIWPEAERLANERLVELLVPSKKKKPAFTNPMEMFFGGGQDEKSENEEESEKSIADQRIIYREKLKRFELEDDPIEIEVEDGFVMNDMLASMGMDDPNGQLNDMMGQFMPKKTKTRRLNIAQAREILTSQEAEKLIDHDGVTTEAIALAEQHGIVFLDEIDKIVGQSSASGPDVSREGVQRDILPIVEGSVVRTKHGNVRTDHILFIAAGAFHISKPEDLIPELQGRFPVRVHLASLTEEDFVRILAEPENSLLKQYQALLSTEGTTLTFTPEGIQAIAHVTYTLNQQQGDTGARRLNTVMEKLLEDIMFTADNQAQEIIIDEAVVMAELQALLKENDFSKYIL